MGKKRCPLLMMGVMAAGQVAPVGRHESGECECVEEQCMWWSPVNQLRDYGECCVTEISAALFDAVRGRIVAWGEHKNV